MTLGESVGKHETDLLALAKLVAALTERVAKLEQEVAVPTPPQVAAAI